MNSPSSHDHHHSTGEAPVETADGRVTDPVCGMQVDPATTPHHADHAGAHFHFCSERCRAKFVADPERYRSEEHTSELQSLMRISYAVFCLKKKKKQQLKTPKQLTDDYTEKK